MTWAMLSSRSKSVPPIWTPRLARMSALRSVARGALGRDADDREVRGAAADVDDQRQLFARHRALVVERCRDRLELEVDVLEALRARGLFELALRRGVGFGIVVDELHRAAEHDVVDRLADMAFEARPSVGR